MIIAMYKSLKTFFSLICSCFHYSEYQYMKYSITLKILKFLFNFDLIVPLSLVKKTNDVIFTVYSKNYH